MQAMRFKVAVQQTSDVKSSWKSGLQALPHSDRGKIRCPARKYLAGSLFLDKALEAKYPNATRWDYAVGVKKTNEDHIWWIEVHPASTSDVKTMLAKKKWLVQWLRKSAPNLNALKNCGFHWVASGKVAILKNSPQARRLAQSGIRQPVKYLEIQ